MKVASISDTKNRLSHYLDLVRNGGTVIIMDRNTPVARLESAGTGKAPLQKGKLERLERQGHLCRGQKSLSESFFKQKLPKAKRGSDIVNALLEDRESSL